jgi:hypothetical protein
VTLSGQGRSSAATLSATPDTVNFNRQPIAGSAVSVPVTFTNISPDPIAITGFSVPALPFTVADPPANGTLGAGDTVTFNVTFSPPGSSGDYVHEFDSVATLDTNVGNFGVAISGTAGPPSGLTTIPNALSFGDVEVGSSATLNFNVGDLGGYPLTITESTPPVTEGFAALSTLTTGTVIAGDTSIQESAQFTPTSDGPFSATWLIEGNDGNGVQSVTLTGTGVTSVPVALRATRVNDSALVGRTVTLFIIGTGFSGSPTITSNEAGTKAIVSHDSGELLTVQVTVRAGSRKGMHIFTIRLANGKSCRVNYLVKQPQSLLSQAEMGAVSRLHTGIIEGE